MSLLRQKLGNNFANSAMKASRASNELTSNWLKRLDATSTTGEAKEAQSQLQSVLDFYNKSVSKSTKAIDWDGYKERIHTTGVVDKIHTKYEKFMKTEYTVESAVSRCGTTTEKMQALDIAMQYNFMLYFVHYTRHMEQLETMRNIGDITKMSTMEVVNLMPETEMLASINQETGNMSPEDYNEDGIFTRICTQFNWGTNHLPPFNHSQDAINCVAVTLGKLGK
jgi:hypothetical protein